MRRLWYLEHYADDKASAIHKFTQFAHCGPTGHLGKHDLGTDSRTGVESPLCTLTYMLLALSAGSKENCPIYSHTLLHPLGRNSIIFTPKQYMHGFRNTLSEDPELDILDRWPVSLRGEARLRRNDRSQWHSAGCLTYLALQELHLPPKDVPCAGCLLY